MFPHDRHHVLHHTSGRPQLVQRAVLVVDTVQENLESWYWEKKLHDRYRLTCSWQNDILKTLKKANYTLATLFFCSLTSLSKEKWWLLHIDRKWKGLHPTILENCKRWVPPLPLLPPLPFLPQDAPNRHCSFPSVPRFKLQKSWMFPNPKDPTSHL